MSVSTEMYEAVLKGKHGQITTLVQQALDEGLPVTEMIQDVLRPAMDEVGQRFSTGDFFLPDLILSAFIHDPVTRALARLPLRLTGCGIVIDSVSIVLMGSLLGAGYSVQVMLVSVILLWGLCLPLVYVAGIGLGYGLSGIWTAITVYRIVQAVAFTWIWRWGRWKKEEV